MTDKEVAAGVLKMMAQATFDQALVTCHSYIESRVTPAGGTEAVAKDIEESYGVKLTDEQVAHAMACGGALILMLLGAAYRTATGSEKEEPADLKSSTDAERITRETLDRIRKLH